MAVTKNRLRHMKHVQNKEGYRNQQLPYKRNSPVYLNRCRLRCSCKKKKKARKVCLGSHQLKELMTKSYCYLCTGTGSESERMKETKE